MPTFALSVGLARFATAHGCTVVAPRERFQGGSSRGTTLLDVIFDFNKATFTPFALSVGLARFATAHGSTVVAPRVRFQGGSSRGTTLLDVVFDFYKATLALLTLRIC